MSGNENSRYVPVHRATIHGADQQTESTSADASPNPLLLVQSLLRGRYILTFLLALGLGGVGAFVGYRSAKPLYESVGLVRIQAAFLDPLTNTISWGGGDAFVDLQTRLMQEESVAYKAMETPEWRKYSTSLDPLAVAGFRESLRVLREKNSELIYVAFKHENPEAAMAAVKSVINSYQYLYGNKDGEVGNGAVGAEKLNEWRRPKATRLAFLSEDMFRIAAEAGLSPESLEKACEQRLLEVVKVESELSRLSITIDLLANQVPKRNASGSSTAPADRSQVPDVEAVAQRDLKMARLFEEREEVEQLMASLRRRYLPGHAEMIDANARLQRVNSAIEKRLQELAEDGSGITAPTESEAEKNLRELRAKYLTETAVLKEAKAKAEALRRPSDLIAKHRQEVQKLEAELKQIDDAIARVRREESFGRIIPINEGNLPAKPAEDKRKKLAAAGGFGGMALGVGLMIGIGFLNRRLVSVEDARLGLKRVDRVLGVLPQLPHNLGDPEEAAIAAHCVHHIRTLLQLEEGLPARRVFGITSPSPGDGKTTLAIALGMSFAASGCRTLLIDCDVIGGGLSAKMDRIIRPKIGRVLRREGLISDEQLRHALAAAQQSGGTVGVELVRLGYATEADVAHACSVQAQSYVGLLDVLAGECLEDCVTGTGKPGLFVLPLGPSRPHNAGELSPASVQRIVTQAREAFDVVLIDTGPALGSLDAPIVATQADAVVLVMARGENHALAKRTVDHLLDVGARIAGVIFNRAASSEVARFSSASSRLSSRQRQPLGEGGTEKPVTRQDSLTSGVGSWMVPPKG